DVAISAANVSMAKNDIVATGDINITATGNVTLGNLSHGSTILVEQNFDAVGQSALDDLSNGGVSPIATELPDWEATVNNTAQTNLTVSSDTSLPLANGAYLYTGDGSDFGFGTY